MNPLAYYLLKMILCSGVLFGYYWLALRNKTFHQWNRFYLLLCVVISLAVPLLKFEIGSTYTPAPGKVLRLLNVIAANDEGVVESVRGSGFSLTPEQWLLVTYGIISAILFVIVFLNGVRIYNILRSFPKTEIGKICFLNTDANGTPFSFFRYIVWNQAIDLNSEAGGRIFQHELAHVQQRHTWDKLFLLVVLIPFWINPFFWLIRKEMYALHEFAADQKAMASHDVSELAQLILNTAFPQQQFLFTNHLFQSTIKRRITMFTKLQNPTVSYFSRILALPLLFIVMAAFVIKSKPVAQRVHTALENPLTIVIDAGHGGESGARIETIYEDAIVLAIAKKIKEQNKNSKLNIILTRESNQNIPLDKRVQIASENKADIFISIHADISISTQNNGAVKPTNESGIHIRVPSKNPPYQQQSEALASVLVQELGTVYNTRKNLIKSKIGSWVLDKNVCPSVLIECGYLTSKKDLQFIKQDQNQNLIANKILDAIERYAVLKNTGKASHAKDTVPKTMYRNKEVAQVVHINDANDKVEINYKDGTKETITAKEANKAKLLAADTTILTVFTPPVIEANFDSLIKGKDSIVVRNASIEEAKNFKGVIELDGKRFEGKWSNLPVSQNEIAYVQFVKGNDIAKEYGVKPNEEILSVVTKSYSERLRRDRDPATKPVFTKMEVEPTFPEENGGWAKFLMKNLKTSVPSDNKAPNGTYNVIVQFIVDEAGKLSDIKPLTNHGYGMEQEVVRILKTSPDWIPAKQNGRTVTAYKKQPVNFVVSGK